MRDRETIDSELRRIALRRQSIRERGGQLSCRELDELLDERLGHRVAPDTPRAGDATPRGRKSALRRFGLPAALPLSLLAVAAVIVVMLAVRKPPPTQEPTAVPPSSARPAPAAPQAPAPPVDLADRAFTGALKQAGVPIPSHDYAIAHGRAVCDFLKNQPDFAAAARSVQQTSIWDADQSTEVTAGAIVSYCPQYESAGLGQMQPGLQGALSDLQAIENKLHDVQGDLHGIEGDLQALPGRR